MASVGRASEEFGKGDLNTMLEMIDGKITSNNDGSSPTRIGQQKVSKAEKARVKARRFYHRRANLLRDLRGEVVELETRLRQLTKMPSAAHTSNQGNLDLLELVGFRNTSDRPDRASLERLMRQLILARVRLNEDNVALRTHLQKSSLKFQYVRDLLLADDDKLYMANPWFFALLRPLTLADCYTIRQQALLEFTAFASNDRYVKPQGCTYGWQENRVVEHDAIKFALAKTVNNHTAESISDRTWRMLTDPVGMAQLYSKTLQIECHVIQKVDRDNVVLYQESRVAVPPGSEDGDDNRVKLVIVKSVVLISRFESSSGYFLLIRGLNREYFEIFDSFADDVMEVWTDLVAWIQSQPTGDKSEHCRSSFAGITPTGGADPKFWLAEIALHVLRWEAAALGTRFSLPATDIGE